MVRTATVFIRINLLARRSASTPPPEITARERKKVFIVPLKNAIF
jgi:hypothetical protein